MQIHNQIPPPLFQYANYSHKEQQKATKKWRSFFETAAWEAWNLYFSKYSQDD